MPAFGEHLIGQDIPKLTSAVASFYRLTPLHKFAAGVTIQLSRESASEMPVTDTFVSSYIRLTCSIAYYVGQLFSLIRSYLGIRVILCIEKLPFHSINRIFF